MEGNISNQRDAHIGDLVQDGEFDQRITLRTHKTYSMSFAVPGTVDLIYSVASHNRNVLFKAVNGIRNVVGKSLIDMDLNDDEHIVGAISAGRLDEDYKIRRIDADKTDAVETFKARYLSASLDGRV